ncbi:MAG: AAA family ATPase [Devosia nanyangense]|uniref:AAA family ATPase n=1 Tax=Devosia nanyangense TaxID=1228055 RepID=A0A933KXV4_9HYPH|nr:AAA family ATPase [Devosia nanyangense]
MPPIEALGERIMVCGPSNAGKSTLAVALGRKVGTTVFHVDRFRHQVGTDWVQRPDEEFEALHDAAILHEHWVMDGNYTHLMPRRIARATGIVLIGDNRWANLRRYFWRTWFQTDRLGSLDGGRDSIKWEMIHWILVPSPRNLARYRRELPATGLPFVETRSMTQLNRLYAAWGLSRK